MLDFVGGDPVKAELFVQLVAITSANTDVPSNLDHAQRAWYQWQDGREVDAGQFGWMSRAADRVVASAGHYAQMDDPSAVARIIRDHLS